MIELQGRCKRMLEHASDEWCLCLCCLDPSLPRIIHMGKKKKKGISLPEQSFAHGSATRFPLSPLASGIFQIWDAGSDFCALTEEFTLLLCKSLETPPLTLPRRSPQPS